MACVGHATLNQQLHFGKETTFINSTSGFVALLSWVAKQHLSGSPLWFVVEAPGVYYEELAYFLADNQQLLSVLLPNKVKHFVRGTELKSKNDQLNVRLLRALARERQVLVRQAAQLQIRIQAYQHSYQPDSRTLARLAAQQQLLVNQLKSLDQDLADLLKAEPELARKLGHLTSIPGVGLTTAIVVVAETNGKRATTGLLCRPGCGAASKRALGPGHAHLAPRYCAFAHSSVSASCQQLTL